MSPLPRSSSAPDESKIILESVFDDTAKDILAGKFALINPATTSADGLWLATTKCMPAALAICDNLVIDSFISFGATNIKSASSSIMITMNGKLSEPES